MEEEVAATAGLEVAPEVDGYVFWTCPDYPAGVNWEPRMLHHRHRN